MRGEWPRRRAADRSADPARSATSVESRCRQRLIECRLWGTSDLSEICARVGEMTGRPLVLSAMELGHQPIHGLLVSTVDVDYVIYEANTSRFHQDHIVMHELSHAIWGHPGITGPDGTGTVAAEVHGRHGFDDLQEREAEMMASLMGQFIETTDLPSAPVVDPVLARVLASFDLRHPGS